MQLLLNHPFFPVKDATALQLAVMKSLSYSIIFNIVSCTEEECHMPWNMQEIACTYVLLASPTLQSHAFLSVNGNSPENSKLDTCRELQAPEN